MWCWDLWCNDNDNEDKKYFVKDEKYYYKNGEGRIIGSTKTPPSKDFLKKFTTLPLKEKSWCCGSSENDIEESSEEEGCCSLKWMMRCS